MAAKTELLRERYQQFSQGHVVRKHKLWSRLVAQVALAVGVFLIATPGAATAANIYAAGGGSVNFAGGKKAFKFSFSAQTGRQGDFGSYRFTIEPPFAPLDAHVDVDCVNLFPNPLGDPFPNSPSAGGWIGGAIKKVTPQPNLFGLKPGDQVLAGMNDYGNPSDLIRDEFTSFVGGFPQQCKAMEPAPHTPIDQGNVVIRTG
jgi:hypothetical protein